MYQNEKKEVVSSGSPLSVFSKKPRFSKESLKMRIELSPQRWRRSRSHTHTYTHTNRTVLFVFVNYMSTYFEWSTSDAVGSSGSDTANRRSSQFRSDPVLFIHYPRPHPHSHPHPHPHPFSSAPGATPWASLLGLVTVSLESLKLVSIETQAKNGYFQNYQKWCRFNGHYKNRRTSIFWLIERGLVGTWREGVL